jgi:hypothetical protein
MRSIYRTWASGSTRESACVVRILDPLFLATTVFFTFTWMELQSLKLILDENLETFFFFLVSRFFFKDL